MSGRRRNWVIWLVGLALLLMVGLVAVVLLSSGANIGASIPEGTATAIAAQNSTVEAQLEATRTADSEATAHQAIAEALTQTDVAQVPTELPTETPTKRPSATPTVRPPTNLTAIATEPASLTEIVANPTSTLSNVQMTATALAILFEQTLVSPTSESVGGAETTTPISLDGGDTPTETPTPLPTETVTPLSTQAIAPQATETPIEIASANLLIRSDVSGEVIGDGTLRVYAPQSAKYPETARVELELHLDNLYITPTPTGERGTAVPRSTTVASSGDATPTPYVPIITDQGVPVYQRMGATLLCAAQSFRGCDAGRDQSQAKIVSSETTTWSWIISPEQNASGLQDLQLDVWLVERNLDGALEYLDLPGTPYHFKIEVNPAIGSNVPLLIGGIVVIIVLIGGAFVVSQRGIKPVPVQPLPLKNAPLVFISYRRGPSWGQARSIEQSLRERGANVFIDIDDINEGHFAETIEKAIQDCDYFVAVLAPGTLESVWVRREIASALAAKKTIVPLLMDGFRLDAENIPTEIRDIASHNAITVLPEFYQEAMNRLAKRFLRLDDKGE